jgi:carboxyl-terminal processing protease
MFLRKFLISIIVIGTIFLSFVSGYAVKQLQLEKFEASFNELDLSLFHQAYNLIQEDFAGDSKNDSQKLIHGAISGMINALGDPHTTFFNSEETEGFIEDTDGRFEGVGMEVGLKENQVTVIAPLKGTPAEKAGILAGDIIVKIDQQETLGMSIEEAVRLIRGPKGTKVSLTVSRNSWLENKKIIIERAVIELPSLEWEMIDNLAHIKFYHFYSKAGDDFKVIAQQILNSSAQGIILDLRNNPGGYLEVAEEIGGWFLEKDSLFLIEDYGYLQKERKTKGVGYLSQYPVVIILDEGSASASEILAGALRDNRKSLIVGQNSFGKGSIQKLVYLKDGSSIKITVANWLTPNKELISNKGLAPDYQVESEEEKDVQLDKAIELLKKMI